MRYYLCTERGIQTPKKVYLCFKVYAKAFDKLHHKELLQLLGRLNLFASKTKQEGTKYQYQSIFKEEDRIHGCQWKEQHNQHITK